MVVVMGRVLLNAPLFVQWEEARPLRLHFIGFQRYGPSPLVTACCMAACLFLFYLVQYVASFVPMEAMI